MLLHFSQAEGVDLRSAPECSSPPPRDVELRTGWTGHPARCLREVRRAGVGCCGEVMVA